MDIHYSIPRLAWLEGKSQTELSTSNNSDRLPPNGLAFSCRERAGTGYQNATDLAREAVNCNHPSDMP